MVISKLIIPPETKLSEQTIGKCLCLRFARKIGLHMHFSTLKCITHPQFSQFPALVQYTCFQWYWRIDVDPWGQNWTISPFFCQKFAALIYIIIFLTMLPITIFHFLAPFHLIDHKEDTVNNNGFEVNQLSIYNTKGSNNYYQPLFIT